jgi:peptide deformylase
MLMVVIMFKQLEILDEKNKLLRKKSEPIVKPLTKEEKKLVQHMIDQLTYSQIEEYEKKYSLRPGMGLAFPQLGILKRLVVIVHEYQEGKFNNYVVINPKIISHSEEMIAADTGEGCLSVNRDVDGHIPRYARVTIEGLDEDMKPIQIRAREELSIAFQHEIDHLEGILFYDHINKDHPFFTENEIRLI